MAKLSQKDVLRSDQFSKEEIRLIMDTAGGYERALEAGTVLEDMKGKILSTLFLILSITV